MKCLYCGKEFEPQTVVQKYCSPSCRNKYYYRHDKIEYPVIHFRCACCGREVVTAGGTDKRTRFCSHKCEKNFWRHPKPNPTHLRSWKSASEYLRWEERQNEEDL